MKHIYLLLAIATFNLKSMDSVSKLANLAKIESEICELLEKESNDKLKIKIIAFIQAGGDIDKKINGQTIADILKERKLNLIN